MRPCEPCSVRARKSQKVNQPWKCAFRCCPFLASRPINAPAAPGTWDLVRMPRLFAGDAVPSGSALG
ncbi:hypothetical protein ColKHC_05503 [Colletotrichum higginsianum]|nr:hypothetical protein ColKHC_05503 [Colletotrichum higginsianum]